MFLAGPAAVDVVAVDVVVAADGKEEVGFYEEGSMRKRKSSLKTLTEVHRLFYETSLGTTPT